MLIQEQGNIWKEHNRISLKERVFLMATLKEKAAYIKGLAEGMGVGETSNEAKLILKLIDLVDDMAERIDDLEEYVDELDAKVDEIDEDLGAVEDDFYDDEDYDDDEDDDYDFEDDDVYEFTCDNCGDNVFIDGDLLDSEDPLICPSCGKEITLTMLDEE